MADPKDALKKKIDDLAAQLAQQKAAGKDLKKDPTCRQLRKTLKRAQRKLRLLTPPTYEQKVDQVAKFTEMVNKRMGELTQGAKKVQANPYVHSLRKKMKSLNKRKKKLDRIAKKKADAAAASAKPKPTPIPEPAPAPEAVAPPAAAPAVEPEKK